MRLSWGLIPSWADDPAIANRLINARSEGVESKPAFRQAFRQRRCLIVADGFYEWQKQGRRKQAYHFRLADGRMFGMAGLWERWQHGEQSIESCTILTTAANELVGPLHERMPVIMGPADYELWLDPAVREPERLAPLLRPYPAAAMRAVPVSSRVNSPAVDDPACVEEVSLERQSELF